MGKKLVLSDTVDTECHLSPAILATRTQPGHMTSSTHTAQQQPVFLQRTVTVARTIGRTVVAVLLSYRRTVEVSVEVREKELIQQTNKR